MDNITEVVNKAVDRIAGMIDYWGIDDVFNVPNMLSFVGALMLVYGGYMLTDVASYDGNSIYILYIMYFMLSGLAFMSLFVIRSVYDRCQ